MNKNLDLKIFDVNANEYVEAAIAPITSGHIEEIEYFWKPQLVSQLAWDKNLDPAEYLEYGDRYQVCVLECNNSAQGIIAFEHNPRYSQIGLKEELIYVSRLKSAPTNRVGCHRRTYKGVGIALILYAILSSFEMGFDGRIGLSSVVGAETFYEGLGFAWLGHQLIYCADDLAKLKYYELDEENAELILLNFSLLSTLVYLDRREGPRHNL